MSIALARVLQSTPSMTRHRYAVLTTWMLTACNGSPPTTAELGARDLGSRPADLGSIVANDLSVADLGNGDAAAGVDAAAPGVVLVEDFCTADLGTTYTRCYVTQQPIDGY